MKKHYYVFDLDDTLVTHDYSCMSINICDEEANVISAIPYSDYLENDGKLPPLDEGFKYDFSDWASSKKFLQSSKSVLTMIGMLRLFAKQPNSTVEIITARTDMDCERTFAEAMLMHGINIGHIPVICAGNWKKKYPERSTPQLKRYVMERQIAMHGYTHVTMYDNSLANLLEFYKMYDTFENIKLKAYYVDVNNKEEIVKLI